MIDGVIVHSINRQKQKWWHYSLFTDEFGFVGIRLLESIYHRVFVRRKSSFNAKAKQVSLLVDVISLQIFVSRIHPSHQINLRFGRIRLSRLYRERYRWQGDDDISILAWLVWVNVRVRLVMSTPASLLAHVSGYKPRFRKRQTWS